MVSYVLPGGTQAAAGLYGQLSIAAGENAPGNKYWGGRIGYAAGPFDVAAAYGESDCLNVACTIDLTAWNIAGAWNFGFMKLSGFFGEMSAERESSAGGGKVERQNWYIGVAAPFGQWNVKASYGGTNGKAALDGNDASQWAIGVDYNLSKRTALYATWGSINNDGASAFVVSTQSSPLTAGSNSQGGQIGVRHTF